MVLHNIGLMKRMTRVTMLTALVERGHHGPFDDCQRAKLKRSRFRNKSRFHPSGNSRRCRLVACRTRTFLIIGGPSHCGKRRRAMLHRQLARTDKARPKWPAQTNQQGPNRECNYRKCEESSPRSQTPDRDALQDWPAAAAGGQWSIFAGTALLDSPRAAVAALGLSLFDFECRLTFEGGAAASFLVRPDAACFAFRCMSANPILIWACVLAGFKVR